MITTPTTKRTTSRDLADAAKRRLDGSIYASIRRLTCECDDQGVLYLRGRLSSYYQKQLAQETVANLPGIVKVVNQAEVIGGVVTLIAQT